MDLRYVSLQSYLSEPSKGQQQSIQKLIKQEKKKTTMYPWIQDNLRKKGQRVATKFLCEVPQTNIDTEKKN